MDIQIIFNVSHLWPLLVFTELNINNVVADAHWHISVQSYDPYDISGTFIMDDMTDTATNTNALDDLYLHLSINLSDDWIPSINFYISKSSDGSLPLSNDEILELCISVDIEPTYVYYQQLHSLPDELLELSKHWNISDLESYMLHLYEAAYGQIHFFPEPDLPPHWERRISDEGRSYFYNKKIPARRWNPAQTFECLSFSSFSLTFVMILASDERHRARQRRNAHRLLLPPFRNRRQLKKWNRLQHAVATSYQIKRIDDVASVKTEVDAGGVDLQRIVVGSCCTLMSLFFIVMIVIGS
jgi:hypothetical protein